jgi:DNA-binding protein HU-beta
VNKNELIGVVAEKSGLARSDATQAVDATLSAIMDALKSGDDVRIVGFGNFSVGTRKGGEGRNPKTGETIQIAESKNAKFKPGKAFKDALNG